MKEILVAAKRAELLDGEEGNEADSWEPIEVPIRNEKDDSVRVLIAYPPGDGQVAAFMATSASFASTQERVAGAVNFLVSVLNDDDHSYIVSRLFDGKDQFGAKHVAAIIEGLMEEWTGRPTESSSGSASSRQTGGRKRTRTTPALT